MFYVNKKKIQGVGFPKMTVVRAPGDDLMMLKYSVRVKVIVT